MSAAGKQNHYPCEQVVPIEQEPRHHLVIDNEFVRAFAVEIAPHDRTLCHNHPQDYLLYVASGSEIISAAKNEEPKRLNYGDGECELSSAGMTHVVENLGEKPFRNVVVELLPRTGGLRRGADPKVIVGDADSIRLFEKTRVAQLFEDDRVSMFMVRIEPGAEVGISGPAVVATPYENQLNPDALEDIEVKSNTICSLAWVDPQREAVLWGCWAQVAVVIVFQIGRTIEHGLPVLKQREPLLSLRAHADQPE
jgi:quercetin dioxygenase-like cupin family protein